MRQIYECVKNFTHTFRVRLWSKSEGEIFSLWEVCKLGTLHSVGSFIFLSTSLPLSTHATKLDSFSQYRWPLMNDRCFVVCNSQRRGDFFFFFLFFTWLTSIDVNRVLHAVRYEFEIDFIRYATMTGSFLGYRINVHAVLALVSRWKFSNIPTEAGTPNLLRLQSMVIV